MNIAERQRHLERGASLRGAWEGRDADGKRCHAGSRPEATPVALATCRSQGQQPGNGGLMAAVRFLPWAWLDGIRSAATRADVGRSLVGHQRFAAPGFEVDADHLTGLQPAQVAANRASRGRPMRPAVRSPDSMICSFMMSPE